MKARHWAALCLLMAWLLAGCQVLFGKVTVHKAGGGDDAAECSVGTFRCNNEYLLRCDSAATGWSLNKTCGSSDLCDSKTTHDCLTCTPLDMRCMGADRQQCSPDGTGWKTLQTCEAENKCSESSCGGCMTDGQLDCSLGSQLRRCEGGVWVNLDMCASDAVCDATIDYAATQGDAWNKKCRAPGCPEARKYDCDGTTLRRCPPEQDDWVTVDMCDNAALCAMAASKANAGDANAVATLDMCKAACPTPDAFLCDGTTLKQCASDQTAYNTVKDCPANTECDPVAGDCGMLCTPGLFQCNGATLRQCGSTGHWADKEACDTAALCNVSADASTGSCKPSPCGKGDTKADYKCDGAVLKKCREDRTDYDVDKTCASAALCDATSARCIDPACTTASAYQCFGQELKQCAADLTAWTPITTCPTGQYCNSGDNPGCLTSCPVNPLRCNGKVLEHCSASTGWTAQSTCSTADLCNCAITDPDGAGPLTNSCAGGLYKDGCGNVVCGGVLATYQCKGAELQKCQAGRNGWDKASTCGAANLCYPGESPGFSNGYCLTCPTAGELACNGSTLRQCSADRKSWNTSANCGALGCNAVQNGDDYCAKCNAGAVQCAGLTLQTCPTDERAWNNQSCAVVCDAAHGQCDKCASDSYWCTTGTAVLNHCSADGQSYTSTTCGSVAQCNSNAKKCDVCTAGQKQCSGSSLQTCNAARTGFDSASCGTPGCNSTTNSCYTCSAGQKQCSGSSLQTCNAARTGFDTASCGTPGCNTTANACYACTAAQKQCSGSTLQTCNAARSGFDNTDCGAPGCNGTTNTCYACTATQKQCSGSTLQTCNAARTGFDSTACANGCNTTTNVCNTCTPNKVQCSGGNLQVCKADGSGTTTTTCSKGCSTSLNACNVCASSDSQCSGGSSFSCKADGSGFETTGGMACGVAGCNAATGLCNAMVCMPSKFTCSGKTLQQCNMSGTVLSTVKTCAAICDADNGECDDCVSGSPPQCTGSVLQTCDSTGHSVTQDCSLTGATCNPAGTCDVPVTPPPNP